MSPRPHGLGAERGAALVLTLLIVALIAGLGGALLLVTAGETAVQAHHQQLQAARQAADAGLACAVADLRRLGDFTAALTGEATAFGCLEPAAFPVTWPNGLVLDPPSLTAALRATAAARYGSIPDAPLWTLRASGLAPAASARIVRPVVLVWLADDVDDGDGDPLADVNGIVWVRVEARGPAGGRAAIEAIVRRGPDGDPPAAVLGWRTVR